MCVGGGASRDDAGRLLDEDLMVLGYVVLLEHAYWLHMRRHHQLVLQDLELMPDHGLDMGRLFDASRVFAVDMRVFYLLSVR